MNPHDWCRVAILFVAAAVSSAQVPSSDLEVLQVKPGFYLIAGAGANIGVQIGPDGVVVVGSGAADKADQVLAAIKKLSDEPIRWHIIENHLSADADQVGGNEKFSKAGREQLLLQSDTSIRAELGSGDDRRRRADYGSGGGSGGE